MSVAPLRVSRAGWKLDRGGARTRLYLPALSLGAIAAGGVLHLSGQPGAAEAIWAGVTALVLAPLAWSVARTLARRDVGVDAIALVAMVAALALGEYLAGAVVSLMLAGGNALEAHAARRARRELRGLVERSPRTARRLRGTVLEEVPVDAVAIGDVVLVRNGEIVPVDGVLAGPGAVVDESALTGEPLPVTVSAGGSIRSGTSNAGEAFRLKAVRPAAESAYAALVRLVQAAEGERAPLVRVADRYAAFFLPVTLLAAGLAWALSGDPVRGLAVLVVATPCPLILAAPIALVSGVSRAARAGVIVKGSSTIEALGRARTILLDKTGTLTVGMPEIDRVLAADGVHPGELLRLAASLDQLSPHTLAVSLVREARRRGLELSFPEDVEEAPGRGIAGTVEGHPVAVGAAGWLREHGYAATCGSEDGGAPGSARIHVGVDGRTAGVIVMADRLRPDAASLIQALRESGIEHVAMVTGDNSPVAEAVARAAGVERVFADLSPEGKVEVVRSLRGQPGLSPIVMVGDGINDAPALAVADVGIALGSAGATISSEAADAVIVVDRIDRVAAAVRIGRRSLAIARQSVLVGIGLSLVAMGFAAFGFISPVFGALLQEGIDVAVILNALRALRQ